jgi:hypothetical protein
VYPVWRATVGNVGDLGAQEAEEVLVEGGGGGCKGTTAEEEEVKAATSQGVARTASV